MYNGLVLLIDDETQTYWDHITGEAVHGPLSGARLEHWGIEMTTAGAARDQEPGLLVHQSRPALKSRIIGWVMNLPFLSGRFPPGFRGTMGRVDDRLEDMCLGLGVVMPNAQRFYPKDRIGNGIDDDLDGQLLHVAIDDADSVPFATSNDGARPLQLFSRWYGFSLTYPNCEIFEGDHDEPSRKS